MLQFWPFARLPSASHPRTPRISTTAGWHPPSSCPLVAFWYLIRPPPASGKAAADAFFILQPQRKQTPKSLNSLSRLSLHTSHLSPLTSHLSPFSFSFLSCFPWSQCLLQGVQPPRPSEPISPRAQLSYSRTFPYSPFYYYLFSILRLIFPGLESLLSPLFRDILSSYLCILFTAAYVATKPYTLSQPVRALCS